MSLLPVINAVFNVRRFAEGQSVSRVEDPLKLEMTSYGDDYWVEYVALSEVFRLPSYELRNIIKKEGIRDNFLLVTKTSEGYELGADRGYFKTKKFINVKAVRYVFDILKKKGKALCYFNWKRLLEKLYGSVMWHKHSHAHLTPGSLQGFVDKCYATCRHEFDSGTRPLPPLGKVGLTDAAMLLQCFDAEGYPNVPYIMEICKLALTEVTKEGFVDSSTLAGMRKLIQEYPKEINDTVRHTRSDLLLARIGFEQIKEDIRCRDAVVLFSFD